MNTLNYQSSRYFRYLLYRVSRTQQRKTNWFLTALRFAWWTAMRFGLLFWNCLEIVGRENIPEHGPVILIANHESHLDCLALAAAVASTRRPDIVPMAAADVFFANRFITVFSRLVLNALPVRRSGRCGLQALRQYRARLIRGGDIFILFPEGGRSRDGEMARFKGGIGLLVAGTRVPVVPCSLEGAGKALAPGNHFVRPARIRLKVGEPLRFTGTTNDSSGWRRIGNQLEREVSALRASGSPPAPGE